MDSVYDYFGCFYYVIWSWLCWCEFWKNVSFIVGVVVVIFDSGCVILFVVVFGEFKVLIVIFVYVFWVIGFLFVLVVGVGWCWRDCVWGLYFECFCDEGFDYWGVCCEKFDIELKIMKVCF